MRDIRSVLFLPKWYPDRYDAQFGVFLQKHARAIARHTRVFVLYLNPDSTMNSKFDLIRNDEGDLTELIVYYKECTTGGPVIKKLCNLWRYLLAARKGLRLAKDEIGRPDIVHVNIMSRPAALAYWLKVSSGIPYVITEEWTGYGSNAFARKPWIEKAGARFLAARANSILTVSRSLWEHMVRHGLKNNYHIIGNIIEDVALRPNPYNDGIIRILNISDHVDWKKGITDIIRVFAEIAPAHPHIELHLIGDGPDHELIKQVAMETGLAGGRIKIYGRKFNDFVYEIMPEIDFLIVNSTFETFSVATAEALVNGKPVIVTRCGGPEEFVTPDVGYVIDHSSPDQLKQAMLDMLANINDFDPVKLSEYAKSRFSYARVGQRIMNIYRSGK